MRQNVLYECKFNIAIKMLIKEQDKFRLKQNVQKTKPTRNHDCLSFTSFFVVGSLKAIQFFAIHLDPWGYSNNSIFAIYCSLSAAHL